MPDSLFESAFAPSSIEMAGMTLTAPEEIADSAETPAAGAWRVLIGSMALRRAGEQSLANAWLNTAMRLAPDNDVFKAELLGEAGHSLYQSDRLQEAFGILDSAEAIWREVCQQAADATAAPESAAKFAGSLAPIFSAAGLAASPGALLGSGAARTIHEWLRDRAVVSRCRCSATLVRLLTRAGQTDDAREILDAAVDWVESNFVTPGIPDAPLGLDQPQMPPGARSALYSLRLAAGELDLAEGKVEESAGSFAAAAAVYEDFARDYSDISAILQAKFNQANSLLRLRRIDEALKIYEWCEYGFGSIGDDSAVQRVVHAKLFARSMIDDDDT